MTFRVLIQQAMREASADFATIVERKLLALLGTGPAAPAPAPSVPAAPRKSVRSKRAASGAPNKSAAKTPKKAAAPAKRPAPAATGPAPTRAAIEAALLDVLPTRSDLSKGPLMAAAKIDGRYSERVRSVLEFLRDAGKIKLTDKQHGSLYSLVTGDGEPGVAAYHDPTAT